MRKSENLWDNLRQGFKEGLQFTVQKTEELTRIGRLRLDIAGVRRQMEKAAAELGHLVFEQLHDSTEITLYVDVTMQDALQTLRNLEARLHRLEDQLERATHKQDENLDDEAREIQDEEDEYGPDPDDLDEDPEDPTDSDRSKEPQATKAPDSLAMDPLDTDRDGQAEEEPGSDSHPGRAPV
jgi:hypothetical protein